MLELLQISLLHLQYGQQRFIDSKAGSSMHMEGNLQNIISFHM